MSAINSTNNGPHNETWNISFIIGTVILSIVFLIGVPGNLFIIWSILARARKRSIPTLLILNLAIADGTVMCLTIFFLIYLAKQKWVFGLVMCKLLFYLCNTNMYASIMLIMLMSLYRLVAVRWPHRIHFFTRRKFVLAVLAAQWLLVFTLALPGLFFRKEEMNDKGRLLCVHNHTTTNQVVFQYVTETVLGFIIPYGIILSSYMCILWRLKQTKFKTVRSEKLIHAIIITFAIFWLPYHVINIVQVVASCAPGGSKDTLRIWESWRPVTSALAFISSCANPVLYTFAGRSYIKADGLAFMAHLFESNSSDCNSRNTEHTVLERMKIRLQNSQNSNSIPK